MSNSNTSSSSINNVTTSNTNPNNPNNTSSGIKYTFPSTLFQLKQFEDFNEHDFLESLTYRLLNEAQKGNDDTQAEYCKVFEELFSRSIVELEKLMQSVNSRTTELIEATEQYTANHENAMNELNTELEVVSEVFKNLEECIGRVGNTTVQIGNALEGVDRQKKRAMEAKKLMEYFEEFNRYDFTVFQSSILPKRKMKHSLFHNRNHQHAAARIMQQLSSIARDLDKAKHCTNGVQNIEYYNSILLRVLSRNLLQSIEQLGVNRRSAIYDLKTRTKIMFDIKEGQRCMELYVDDRFYRFLQVTIQYENDEIFEQMYMPVSASANRHDDDSDSDDDSDDDDSDSSDSSDSDDSDEDTDSSGKKKNKKKSNKDKTKRKDAQKKKKGSDSDDSDDDDSEDTKKDDDEDDSDSDDDSDDSKDSEKDSDEDTDDKKKQKKKSKKQSKKKDKKTTEKEAVKKDTVKKEDDDDDDDDGDKDSDDDENSDNKKEDDIELTKEEKEKIRLERNKANVSGAISQIVSSVKKPKDFSNFLTKIEKFCRDEFTIIEPVFDTHAKDVIAMLLQRMIEQILKVVIDSMLKEAAHDELIQYLTLFEELYTECLKFVDRLSRQSGSNDLPVTNIQVLNLFELVFSSHRDAYAQYEIKYLETTYLQIMSEVKEEENRKLEKLAEKKQQKGLFSGWRQKADLGALLATLQTPDKSSKNIQDEFPDLSLLAVVELIKENEWATRRCKKLSNKKDLASNVYEIFSELVDNVAEYVDRGLDFALSTVEVHNAKNPPMPYFFKTLQIANSILQNLQRHLEQSILPIVSSDLNIQLNCLKKKDTMFSKLEIKVALGLELNLKSIIDHVSFLFESEQKKTDFKPKEAMLLNIYVDNNPTVACLRVCQFLEGQLSLILASLYGGNREFFLTELGMQLYQAITNALKDYQISHTGAIKFMRDLAEYQRVVRKFEISVVDDKFDLLREIASLFLVAPQNIPNVLEQMKHRRVSRDELTTFIKMRADYRTELKGLFDSV